MWGGPNRDFHVALSAPLADSWPSGGPKKLWERELGEGYSAIAVRGDTLYTMYRRDAAAWQIFTSDQEIVVALDARTGRTKWEFAYDVRFRSDQGSGPHVMPQVSGDLVFSVGATGKLHALEASTGKLVWKRDLGEEFGATTRLFGYSSHPSALPRQTHRCRRRERQSGSRPGTAIRPHTVDRSHIQECVQFPGSREGRRS